MSTIADQLINHETGQFDRLAILECATLRAQREWGGPSYPPSYFREAYQWAMDRAHDMQLAWRRDNGLSTAVPNTLWLVDPLQPARRQWQ